MFVKSCHSSVKNILRIKSKVPTMACKILHSFFQWSICFKRAGVVYNVLLTDISMVVLAELDMIVSAQ